MEDTIITFTENELETIKTKKADYNWPVNRYRAGNCKYLVCCHSQAAKRRTAFLVGLISEIVASDEVAGRSKICISEYANIDIPDLWNARQGGFRYKCLEELGINISDLKFEKL